MTFEVKIGERIAKVDLHNRSGNKALIEIDNQMYEVDIVEVEEGIYSILYNDKSYAVELIENGTSKKYAVNTYRYSFDVEIIDAESKYLKNRDKGLGEKAERIISTPMPGKVVKIFVSNGDEVKAGQTVIVVEAMKMQNEYQAKKDSTVNEVMVKEGDIVNANQTLIILE